MQVRGEKIAWSQEIQAPPVRVEAIDAGRESSDAIVLDRDQHVEAGWSGKALPGSTQEGGQVGRGHRLRREFAVGSSLPVPLRARLIQLLSGELGAGCGAARP